MAIQAVNETVLYCTTDDGQTWKERPLPGVPGSPSSLLGLLAISRDGSLYGLGFAGSSEGPLAFYYLPPDATDINGWQLLSTIPYSTNGSAYNIAASDIGVVFHVFPSVAKTHGKTTIQPNYYVATYP